jgi:hypothetical protein
VLNFKKGKTLIGIGLSKDRCPRCLTKLEFPKEKFEKQYFLCPECYTPLKLVLNGSGKVKGVVEYEQPVMLEFKVNNGSEEWAVNEMSMPREVYFAMVEAHVKLQTSKVTSWLGQFQLFFDPMSAVYIDRKAEEQRNALTTLERIYEAYPYQFQLYFKRMKGNIVEMLSIPCPKCKLLIPRGRLNNCPFCKDKEKHKVAEDPLKVLKLRLARGEISKKEYEELKKLIEN